MTACYSLFYFCCSLLAIGCLLLAVPFCFSLIWHSFRVTRPLAARCVLSIVYCILLVTPYSLLTPLTAQLSLLSSRLVSSADRYTYSRIVHPCSRCVIHFSPRKSPPHAHRYHSTLIASQTLFLVARRSLFEICCFLLADRFALLNSCFSLLFASHSVLVTGILLLADSCFLILISLIKGPKLFTLMTLNLTRIFRSIGLGLNLWEHNLGQIFQN